MSSYEAYLRLLGSGMFWEFFPNLTGVWEKDKEDWNLIFSKLKL